MTSFKDYVVFVSEEEPFIYLYNEGGVWYLSDRDQSGSVYAKYEADADMVYLLGKHSWQLSDPDKKNIAVDVVAVCDSKSSDETF